MSLTPNLTTKDYQSPKVMLFGSYGPEHLPYSLIETQVRGLVNILDAQQLAVRDIKNMWSWEAAHWDYITCTPSTISIFVSTNVSI